MIKEIRIATKKIMAENGVEYEYMFSEKRAKQKRTLKFFNLRYNGSVHGVEIKTKEIAKKLRELFRDTNIKIVKAENAAFYSHTYFIIYAKIFSNKNSTLHNH